MDIPLAFKPLTTYIRRAEELDKDGGNSNASIVAFYCRMYAIEKGMKLGLPQSECDFLFKIMGIIEKSPHTSVSKEVGKVTCEEFALHVFHIADEEDRGPSGAGMSTAKIFYSAAAYFDILEQFGELEPDISEKRRYAKWKAADIVKCIKQGIKPVPGAVGEVKATDSPAGAPASAHAPESSQVVYDIPAAPSAAPMVIPPPLPIPGYEAPPAAAVSQPTPSAPAPVNAVPPAPTHVAPPAPAPVAPVSFNTSSAPRSRDDPRCKDCVEYCHFAIAALKHNDINLARQRLQEALSMLE